MASQIARQIAPQIARQIAPQIASQIARQIACQIAPQVLELAVLEPLTSHDLGRPPPPIQISANLESAAKF